MSMVLIDGADEIWTLSGVSKKNGRHIQLEDLSVLKKAVLVANTKTGLIEFVGPKAKIPKAFHKKISKTVSAKGTKILPGFVECHTHSIFAGNRSDEFEMRNQGVSYQEIAARGGGILSSMRATRSAKETELKNLTQKHVHDFVRQGVTTLEIKTGYGLSLKDEVKCLTVLKKITGPKIVPTFLGAHAIPPEFTQGTVKNSAEYLQMLIKEVLPVIRKKKLADRIDIFVENGFFNKEDAANYFQAAKKMGFSTCVHADQITLSGGTDLAIQMQSLSADHMIQVTEDEVKRFANSEITAVLLPAADLYMKCAYPPARELLDKGARVALATDFNPGTSPTKNLSLVGLLARLEMKMRWEEVIAAYTFNAAAALGLQDKIGTLEVGKSADFILVESDIRQFAYDAHPLHVSSYFQGKPLHRSGF